MKHNLKTLEEALAMKDRAIAKAELKRLQKELQQLKEADERRGVFPSVGIDEVLEEGDKTEGKFRCPEYGDANSSDACLQCPSNEECAEETVKRMGEGDKK